MADRPRKALILARGGRLSPGERQILERVEQELPEGAQLQIWSEFEIFDSSGAAQQIDAIALGHYGLYAVEVKHLAGGVPGAERARSIEAMRRQHVVNATLSRARENASRLQDFLSQELGGGTTLVEPLVLLSNDNLEIALPEATRRNVATASDMLHTLVSGELPGDVGPPARVPIDAAFAQAIAKLFVGLRRRIRPGRGSLRQELPLLQRDIVADLTDTVARSQGSFATPRDGGRRDDLRYRIEEAATAWVIACVFVRVLEERDLIERQLAGEGVEERERAFRAGGSRTPRDYLVHLLSVIGQHPACEPLLGQGNRDLWAMRPTEEGAAALLSFFRGGHGRGLDRDRQELLREGLWGDLFQDISEPLHKTNSTVQTPPIIEKLLLDRTLDPAIEEFGAARVRVIDPACGSGTLLVGAFRRLLARHSSPLSSHHALAALDQLQGIDVSPAATMISRIRLLLAYCKELDCKHISSVPALPLHVITADSLLPPPGEPLGQGLDLTMLSPVDRVFAQRYTVVVCAPPLSVPTDPAFREAYRECYRSAVGRFLLSSLFVERCFQLAEHDGFVGMLVGNSFMKREFGKPLVEEVLTAVELTHVIDTSGAYIPGYGTPTVMLLGRNRAPKSEAVRVVVGKRGEPIAPIDPAKGRVWFSIVEHLDHPEYEDDFIAVSDMRREQLAGHPWSLGARDELMLLKTLERGGVRIRKLAASVRRGPVSGRDEVFVLPRHIAERLGLEHEVLRPLVAGAAIRDFSCSAEEVALVPSERDLPRSTGQCARWWAWLQRYRPLLADRRSLGSVAPTAWWAWMQPPADPGPRMRVMGPMVARNNHFALAPGDVVASRTVLVIEPGDDISEAELYSWLAFLNSSTASFWMKQFAFSKASASGELVYEFSSAIHGVPIPRAILEPGALKDELVALARQLERTAKELAAASPEQVLDRWDRASREALVESLADAQLRERTLLRRMVCEQEDLDWLVYEAIGLTEGEHHILKGAASPEQRPFAWLTDEPPVGLDRRLTETWRRRRKAGQARGPLKVLEAAPYKRAFRDIEGDRGVDLDEAREELDLDGALPALERRDGLDYQRRTELACERWLLDRMEEIFRDTRRCVSVQELVSRLGVMAGVPEVAAKILQERDEVSDAAFERHVVELANTHAVPYLAALRHTEPGLEKRAQWEAAWALVRRQDAGEPVASIPVPPRYDRTDYRDASTFRHRGRLDIPTERFIAYPGEGDAAPRYGWAGWTPVQQADVLVALVEQCREEGKAAEHIVPLLAGLMELVLWMPSWDGAAPAPGSAAKIFQLQVQHEVSRLGLDMQALGAWRPAARVRRAQFQGKYRS